jgi:hypothetical protein
MTIARSWTQKQLYNQLQKSSGQIYQYHKLFIQEDSSSNFVQILAQNLAILVTTTYPKSSSRDCVDFAETQI